MIMKLDPRKQIYNLLYFEWPAMIALVYISLAVLILIFWRPVKPKLEPTGKKALPVLLFLIAIPLFAYATLLLPYTLFKIGKPIIDSLDPLIHKQIYIRQSFWLAVFLSASLADCALGQIKRPWVKAVYLAVPFPLLWWNFAHGLFPSRYWTFWKAPLVLVSFASAFLAFFTEPEEIRQFAPMERAPLARVEHEPLGKCTGYQIQLAPDGNTLYVNCNNVLTRFEISDTGWKENGLYDPDGQWDEAAFSYAQKQAYIFIGELRRLDVVDLNSMTRIESVKLDSSLFPQRHPGIHQAFSERKNLLIVAENFGVIQVLNGNGFTQKTGVDMTRAYSQIWRILLDDTKGELYVLQDHALWVMRIDDLKILRHLEFEDSAIDMYMDEPSESLFISFPKIMEVRRYDAKTLDRVDRIPAPASVRAIAVDSDKNLLITGSYNGVISVRDLKTHEQGNRIQVTPYLRRICLWPENEELLVSFANYKVLHLRYLSSATNFSLSDWMLAQLEKAFRLTTINTGDEKAYQ